MTLYENRFRKSYLRRQNRRDVLIVVLMLIVFLAPYVVVSSLGYRHKPLDCLVPVRSVCVVSWADSVPMYDVGK